ncbi:hypothetical protein LTR40_008747, partial [Exophiala xenobiotica]
AQLLEEAAAPHPPSNGVMVLYPEGVSSWPRGQWHGFPFGGSSLHSRKRKSSTSSKTHRHRSDNVDNHKQIIRQIKEVPPETEPLLCDDFVGVHGVADLQRLQPALSSGSTRSEKSKSSRVSQTMAKIKPLRLFSWLRWPTLVTSMEQIPFV